MSTWNLADLFESVVDVVSERPAIVTATHLLTYGDLEDRANRLAGALADMGVDAGTRVGVALHNDHPYLEAMFAAFKLRAVPININTRYTEGELAHLLDDAQPAVVIHETDLTQRLDHAAASIGLAPRTLAMGDYEATLASQDGTRQAIERSGDDRYVIYTGGTTGRPKGVLWRHEDLVFSALSGANPGGEPPGHPDEVPRHAVVNRARCLPASPFAHGTASWMALTTLVSGGTVVVDAAPTFDAERLWDLAEREHASLLVIVGDAFALPLADALHAEPHRWQLDDLLVVLSGGAVLSSSTRARLHAQLPWAVLVDGYGTSETGGQGQMPYWAGQDAFALPRFHVEETTVVLDDAGRPAPPGSGIIGRLARRGRVPLGYLNEPEGSGTTFVELSGQRWAIPGDLGRIEGDGSITLLGRGSSSINTGGEKVFPEEVEIILKAHAAVFDAVVVGLADARFGERIAAVVALRPGHQVDRAKLEQHCRTHLAPYKVPRTVAFVEAIQYRPSGKADLRWAAEALAASPPSRSGSSDSQVGLD